MADYNPDDLIGTCPCCRAQLYLAEDGTLSSPAAAELPRGVRRGLGGLRTLEADPRWLEEGYKYNQGHKDDRPTALKPLPGTDKVKPSQLQPNGVEIHKEISSEKPAAKRNRAKKAKATEQPAVAPDVSLDAALKSDLNKRSITTQTY